MDTNSKSKNKWRVLIAIVVIIGLTVGALYALEQILDALLIRRISEEISYGGHYEYVKLVNGYPIRYRTSGDTYVQAYNTFMKGLAEYGIPILFWSMALCMACLVLFLRNKRIWKGTECVQRKKSFYIAELLVFALCCIPVWYFEFEEQVASFFDLQMWRERDFWTQIKDTIELINPVILSLVFFFLCFWYLRPLFSLGVKGYLREYSLLWALGRWCLNVWKKFRAELDATDFTKEPVKLLLRAVIIQGLILLVCVCCWFVGIPLLLVYSVALFFFLRRYYTKMENGYYEVLRETKGIANGDLTGEVEGDFGMFEPLGEELGRVKDGFCKAVEEEVKSQRMKTELITNVSHDLKTPLTAIMTYVELLKREEITPEERASYVETLDKKSKRLKVLIEDLFEVSKAASNTLTLHPAEVDMGQLVKQVAVEYEERFADSNLQIRKDVEEERLPVWVDGQKTSRILENLFSNICKYAMPESRVYVQVNEDAGMIKTVLKNISAEELNVSGDEITERFVRGDKSRNTEGSGLGLAIARNLTEAQGGSFGVEIDGDLFKVTVSFPKY